MSDLVNRLWDRHCTLYGAGSSPSCITEAADLIEQLESDKREWMDRYFSLYASIQTLRESDMQVYSKWAEEVNASYRETE